MRGSRNWRRRAPLGGDDPTPAALVSFGTRPWIVGSSRPGDSDPLFNAYDVEVVRAR